MMYSPFTLAAVVGAPLFGFAVMWTGLDIAEDPAPPAIEVHQIEIWDDESTFYDRKTQEGKWLAWSGQVFSEDLGEVICRGGGTNQYYDDANPLGTKDVSWLVDSGCSGKIAEGQKWVFTWTPLDSDYAPVRYPAEGYGVVKSAAEKGRPDG